MPVLRSVLGLLLCAAALSAASEPTDVPDPYGLGERLALIDWLRSNDQPPKTGASIAELRAAYRAASVPAEDPAAIRQRDRRARLEERLRRLDVAIPADASFDELVELVATSEAEANQRRVVGEPSRRPTTAVTGPDAAPISEPAIAPGPSANPAQGHAIPVGDDVDWRSRDRVAMRSLRVERGPVVDVYANPLIADDSSGLTVTSDSVVVHTGFAVPSGGANQLADLLRQVAIQSDGFVRGAAPIIDRIIGRTVRVDRVDVVLQRRVSEAIGVTHLRMVNDEMHLSVGLGIGQRTEIDDNVAETLRHELAHALLQAKLQTAIPPGWLHEAVATYFEPWDPSRSDNRRRLERDGSLFTRAARAERARLMVDPAAGWMLGDTGDPVVYIYGQAFMHFLLHDRTGRIICSRLFDAIRDGHEAGEWLAAQRGAADGSWTAAFRAHCARMGWGR